MPVPWRVIRFEGNFPLSRDLKLSSAVNIGHRPGWWTTLKAEPIGLITTLDWTIVGSLTLLVILGFGLRLNQISAIGFAEDEMNKLDAVHAKTTGGKDSNQNTRERENASLPRLL